jgi:hypothetical protein
MRFIGLLLILFGIADFGVGWFEIDVWYDWFGIDLPDWLYYFSAIIEIAIGSALMRIGNDESDGSTDSG